MRIELERFYFLVHPIYYRFFKEWDFNNTQYFEIQPLERDCRDFSQLIVIKMIKNFASYLLKTELQNDVETENTES